jgi:23S rRNA (adenine2503-C2)-methyltransferase
VNAYDLSAGEMADLLAGWAEPPYRARQVWDNLWRRCLDHRDMTDLPASLRSRLATAAPALLEEVTVREADDGATRKALLRVGRGHVVETVLMGYPDRVTVCISSQVGCAMGCGFCATGQMGLEASLTAGEIAAQVVWARRAAGELPHWTPQRLGNVVFMGMGEPFANYRATSGALGLLTAAMGVGARHITVSTVGLVPGIRRLGTDHPQVGLAVSLHAATDDLRDRLVPVNRRWPLAEVERAVAEWRTLTHRRASIEWAMIAGVNDSPAQARALAPIASRLHAHVNLIPLNPTGGSRAQPASRTAIETFVSVLRREGVTATVRNTRGREIDAACGQLRTSVSVAAPGLRAAPAGP